MTVLGWVVFVSSILLMVQVVWQIAGRLAAWQEQRRGWQALTSGSYRVYSHGVQGYVSHMSTPHYWWVTRDHQTVIEGYARTLDAAKLAVDGEVKWITDRP